MSVARFGSNGLTMTTKPCDRYLLMPICTDMYCESTAGWITQIDNEFTQRELKHFVYDSVAL